MAVNGDKGDYICSVEAAVNEIGGKWKSLVLCSLKDGKLRFGEINNKLPEISQRMLTKTLRELVKDRISTEKCTLNVAARLRSSQFPKESLYHCVGVILSGT